MADPSVTAGGVTYRVTPEYLAQAASSTDNTAPLAVGVFGVFQHPAHLGGRI